MKRVKVRKEKTLMKSEIRAAIVGSLIGVFGGIIMTLLSWMLNQSSLASYVSKSEFKQKVYKLKKDLEHNSEIDIRDADGEVIFEFRCGEYTLDEFDERFINSLANFTNLILRELMPYNISYSLYIKGSADLQKSNELEKKKFKPPYNFDRINVYKKAKNPLAFKYIRKYKTYFVDAPIRNRDLPNLRARFIQKKLEEVYPEMNKAIILDGDVDARLGQEYRSAMLLLFVDWPENRTLR